MSERVEVKAKNLMEGIRDGIDGVTPQASDVYRSYVPSAYSASIEDVGNPILNYQAVQNEFLDVLINRIAYTKVKELLYKNQLSILKTGNMPLGQDLQEIGIDPAIARPFDPTGSNLLLQEKPNVHVLYHRLNRRDRYKVTVNDEMLRTAFVSWENLNNFVTGIINSMYNGCEMDEFQLMLNTFGKSVVKSDVTSVKLTPVTDETTGKVLAKNIITYSDLFTFPSTGYNKIKYKTHTPLDRQVLLVRADVYANLNVDVLAYAFNMSRAEFAGRTIKVPDFGPATNVMAMLVDETFIQVYDNLRTTREFYNAEGLYWNYFLHIWQTYSYSLLANAIAFTDGTEVNVSVSSVTVTPDAVSLNPGSQLTFTADLAGTGPFDEGVTWSVSGGKAGTSINNAGTLIIASDETASSLTVKAVSNQTQSVSGTATVTVNGNA